MSLTPSDDTKTNNCWSCSRAMVSTAGSADSQPGILPSLSPRHLDMANAMSLVVSPSDEVEGIITRLLSPARRGIITWPFFASIRFLSSGKCGLCLMDSATIRKLDCCCSCCCIAPPFHSTTMAVESPTLATYKVVPILSATMAVVPEPGGVAFTTTCSSHSKNARVKSWGTFHRLISLWCTASCAACSRSERMRRGKSPRTAAALT
mmetsp:Transcript_14464/g.40139  ORF Transcript_14464/g.40139 Transcript_14464/m.40139 type:complete len:207 (-) Transcript_14464:878-1498(-)